MGAGHLLLELRALGPRQSLDVPFLMQHLESVTETREARDSSATPAESAAIMTAFRRHRARRATNGGATPSTKLDYGSLCGWRRAT